MDLIYSCGCLVAKGWNNLGSGLKKPTLLTYGFGSGANMAVLNKMAAANQGLGKEESSCCPPRPRATPFPEGKIKIILGVIYGVLMWADMNVATPPGARGRSVIADGGTGKEGTFVKNDDIRKSMATYYQHPSLAHDKENAAVVLSAPYLDNSGLGQSIKQSNILTSCGVGCSHWCQML